ncbi:hypothetical protein N7457_001678 [Penicillium paradoxum]|uniref:uncharacterized protein n=1 Tax=Penicillium paradoxum TaxID=176176 RepID=UPI0025499A18|nr:uncharacterized protein N7457_001678 [Penicillium paradoxum]KAJ5795079.1 hypothetical protein N7457_001678 [Penicillium paradoxum]
MAMASGEIQEVETDCEYEMDGLAVSASVAPSRQLRSGVDWVLGSGSSLHICTNKNMFITFEWSSPEAAIRWETITGQQAKDGHGDVILPMRKPDGSRYELQVHCAYKPDNGFSLLSMVKLSQDLGITWDIESKLIRDKNEDTIGYTFIAKHVPFIELAGEVHPAQYSSSHQQSYDQC